MATRTLEVKLTGDSIKLQKAFDDAEKKGAKTAAELDVLKKRLDEVQTSSDRTSKSQKNLAKSNNTVSDSIRDVNQKFTGMRNVMSAVKWPAMIAGAGYAAEGIGTVGAAAVGTTSALAPLGGALAAYPALFGAFGQAAGVVAVAQLGEFKKALGGSKSAMEKLTPAAKGFLGQIKELDPAYKRLQKTVQQNLFAGLNKGLASAKGDFSVFEGVLGNTATAMGNIAERAGALIGSKGFSKDLKSIGDTNTVVLTKLGGAGLALGDALRQVMVAAEPLVKWMSGVADSFAHYIDKAATAGRETGTLHHFFDETRKTMETVGSLVGNVATGFWDIGKAAKPLGDEILKSLNGQAKDFSTWTSSLTGQNALKSYFAEAKPGIFELGRLLKDASGDMIELSKGKGFLSLTRALRTELLPVADELVKSTTAAFGPALIKGLVQVGKLLGNIAGTSGPLTLFVNEVTSMLTALNWGFKNIPGLKLFVVTLGGIATVEKAMKFTGMVTGLKSSLGLLERIAAKLGFIEASEAGTGVVGGAPIVGVGGAAKTGTTAAADAGEFGEKQALRDAGLFGTGAAASNGASLGAKLGMVGADGAATGLGLATAGVATVTIVAATAVINPAKLGESPSHEKELHLKGLEFNVGTGKSEKQFLALQKGFQGTMTKIRSDAIGGMGAINAAMSTGLQQVDEIWAHGTPKWRAHTTEAMRATVTEIKQGMHDGTISVTEGREEIGQILKRLHLLTGTDPLGLASGVTKEFKQTGSITSAGVANFTRELQQMPVGAREQTRAATAAMLQEWAKGHPKLEREVDAMNAHIATSFKQSGKAAAAAQRHAMQAIIEQVGGASSSVAGGLTTIGANLASALRALGAHNIPEFKIEGEKRTHNLTPEIGAATGFLAGQGRQDSVAIMAAPGEAILNRHQQRPVEHALRNTYGIGLPELFQRIQTPHYMASGGFTTDPRLSGGGAGLREGGQDAINDVYRAARKYYERHDGIGRVISNGNRMDALHQPYLWGGGHGATASKNGPWDCSGGISELFDGAGWNFAPMVSGGFMNWGLPGKGDVSVLASTDHVYAVVKGKGAIGTSDYNPGGGFGWVSDYTYRPGFTIRHADFSEIGAGAKSGGKRGKGQDKKKGFAKGGVVSGKVSYFNESEDPSHGTAGGSTTSQPGIALNLDPGTESGWENATTLGWMEASRAGHPVYAQVSIAGKSAMLPITDLGPAASTGRAIDVTEGGVRKLGFTTATFPTDATGTAKIIGGGAGDKSMKPRYVKGETHAGGTSAGFSTHKEIAAALKSGAKHAANPKISHDIDVSTLPSWARGLPLYQREELEGRGTTLPERETILGNAETNAAFGSGMAERALEKARTAYGKNPSAANWAAVGKASAQAQVERKAKAAAAAARKAFEKGYIDHLTVRIKEINAKLSTSKGKLTMKQVAALEAKRAELVSLRASARGEAQTAVENLQGYEEAGEAEAAELESESPLGQAAAAISELTSESFEFPELEKQSAEIWERIEAGKSAGEEHTAALKELTEALNAQTQLASQATATKNAAAWGALADILSGHLGARANLQAQGASNGSVGRF